MQAELQSAVAFEQIGGAELEAVVPFLMKAISEVNRVVDKLAGELLATIHRFSYSIG